MQTSGLSPELAEAMQALSKQREVIHQMQQRYIFQDFSAWPPDRLPYSSDDLETLVGALRHDLTSANADLAGFHDQLSASAAEDIIRLTKFIERNEPRHIETMEKVAPAGEFVHPSSMRKTPPDRLRLEPPGIPPASDEERVLEFGDMIGRLHAFDNAVTDRRLQREFVRTEELRAAQQKPYQRPQGEPDGEADTAAAQHVEPTGAPKRPKRSTEKGEANAKLIAGLTLHHKYADGGCLNLEPIGNNKLARNVGVAESTASTFFRKEFEGHTKYRSMCKDQTKLVGAIKLLNQEYSPHVLYGPKPPDKGGHKDVE